MYFVIMYTFAVHKREYSKVDSNLPSSFNFKIRGHDLPSDPIAMDSGPTILLFRICWVDLSLLFSVSGPVSFGAGGILKMETRLEQGEQTINNCK